MLDLIQIGKFGVLNAQKLISTTSNNINNVNTEGYTRKQTLTYTSSIDWGVGNTDTRRIYSQYVQRELYADNGNKSYYEAAKSGMSSVDSMLSDDEMSVSTAFTKYFNALSSSVQNPTSTSAREEVLADLKVIQNRFTTLNGEIQRQIADVNGKINDSVSSVNSLTRSICELNRQILASSADEGQAGERNEIYLQMQDKRDLLIKQLSEQVGINTVTQSNGSISVYMSGNGQLLCNDSTYATITGNEDQFDSTRQYLTLKFNNFAGSVNDATQVRLNDSDIGGAIGGYLASCSEIRQTMRDLGRLSVSFADALNQQNRAGFTLEGIAGDNIFTVKDLYAATDDPTNTQSCLMNFVEGKGSNVTANDYKISFEGGQLRVFERDAYGKETELKATDYVVKNDAQGNMVIDMSDYAGINLSFNSSRADLENGKHNFLIQPTLHAAYTTEVNISKPEDLAYASAVRTSTTKNNNLGNAVISLASMSAVGPDMGVSVDPATKMPVFNQNAPVKVIIADDGSYNILNKAGDVIGTAPASCKGQGLFSQAVDLNGNAFNANGFPGYEINITGTVEPGDSFEIEINTNGVGDNTNGNIMSAMKDVKLVGSTGTEKITFNEGYASLTTRLGSAVYSADTNLAAAESKQEQTQELYDSEAGVNLDEEAADLIKYQQTYQACAKIITASQTIFDSLISAF
ncbi:MAG TPA: flagellar hook-associated protein FlgK [Succinivibrionaceae bacterium]|nr:flagellar hook-associated protein FlgK [Succinivibrionaceae bacterium]